LKLIPICRALLRRAGRSVLTDGQWAALEPLVERCRPQGKTPPRDLRRTIEAIVWRDKNGAIWRAVPAGHGLWWRAAQLFRRWAKLGAWQRLLEMAQERGIRLGVASLDGTSIWAHPKAAGPPKKGEARASVTAASFLGVLCLAATLDCLKP
jgi:transposase